MKQIYEAWEDPEDDSISLSSSEEAAHQRSTASLSKKARLLYRIEADTFEEAAAIHNLRMGWGSYNPLGDPSRCPKCDGWYYPKGSGECWRSGRISPVC